MPASRFSQLIRGTRAVKTITLPLWGAEHAVGVRPLTGAELGSVLGNARAYAVKHGLAEPKDGDRLFELGQMCFTIAASCVSVDPTDAPSTPYFADANEVLDNLDPDTIVLLYESQQAWQDECAPRADKMGGDDFIDMVVRAAGWESGPDPLRALRPSMQATFVHTLAALYLNSLSAKSSPSSSPAAPVA